MPTGDDALISPESLDSLGQFGLLLPLMVPIDLRTRVFCGKKGMKTEFLAVAVKHWVRIEYLEPQNSYGQRLVPIE